MRARLVLVFLTHQIHRRFCNDRKVQKWIHKWKMPWALLAQPYVLFHAVFVWLLVEALVEISQIIHAHSWLDSSTFKLPNSPGASERYEMLHGLRYMTIACPVFIVLTTLVTLSHVCLHHLAQERRFDKGLRWYLSHSHDLAMQVATLPMIYGVFALDCVIQMLQLMTGRAFGNFHSVNVPEKKTWGIISHLTQERYSTNLELADLYEAWALYNFGRLCLMRVRRQVRLEIPLLRRALMAGLHVEHQERLLVFSDPERFLFRPLEVTTGIGVKIFVYTCMLKSILSLTITFLADEPFHINVCEQVPTICAQLPCMEGAAFVTSSIAILSLIAIEHGFHDILSVEGFAPILKFLGVKLLVSITFIQSLLMNVVMKQMLQYSDEQIQLGYACLLCFEVLPISLLTYVAWKPSEGDWYDGDCGWGPHGGWPHVGRLAGEGDWCESYAVLPRGSRAGSQSFSSGDEREDKGSPFRTLPFHRIESSKEVELDMEEESDFGESPALHRWVSTFAQNRLL